MPKLTKLGLWVRELFLRPASDGERGASLVEYALLLALITVVCVVAIASMGTTLNESYSTNTSSLFTP